MGAEPFTVACNVALALVAAAVVVVAVGDCCRRVVVWRSLFGLLLCVVRSPRVLLLVISLP